MQETKVSVPVAKTSIINAKNSELIDLSSVSESVGNRITLDNTEINRVLGGGITSDSVILITGEPGIGKSTMLLQIANDCSNYGPVLYLSGEESDRQIKSRATRLGISGDNLILSSNTYLEEFLKDIENYTPSLWS
jgi:Predicted ATP-dependent serine protease